MEEVSVNPRPPIFGHFAACSLCIRPEHSRQLMLILSLKKAIRPPHSSNARRWEEVGGRMAVGGWESKKRLRRRVGDGGNGRVKESKWGKILCRPVSKNQPFLNLLRVAIIISSRFAPEKLLVAYNKRGIIWPRGIESSREQRKNRVWMLVWA